MGKTGFIIKKELFRVFGDRKMIFSLFILPAVIVIGIYSLMGQLIGKMESDITEHVSTVKIVNATDALMDVVALTSYGANAEIEWLDDAQYAKQEADLKNDIVTGNIDLLVVFDKNFEAEANAYEKEGDAMPRVDIFYNSTENYSSQARSVFSSLVLDAYGREILTERFGDYSRLTPFTQNYEVLCKEEKANTEFISMLLPYMIVMLLFAGVMSVGVDALAGEKERGTLSSMLISPVSRAEIATGKLVSLAILSGLSSFVYAGSMIIAVPMMSAGNAELANMGYAGVKFGFVQIIELLALMLALVYLYVGVVGLLSILAKDTKTASTYVSPVYIVVVVCGMMTMFTSGREVPFYRYCIPVYGNALAIKDICGNELSPVNFLCSFGATLLLGIILTFFVKKAFDSEKIMFNA